MRRAFAFCSSALAIVSPLAAQSASTISADDKVLAIYKCSATATRTSANGIHRRQRSDGGGVSRAG